MYDLSNTDSTPDNDETVTCSAKRYFTAKNVKLESVSNIVMKLGEAYTVYTGFGIWEDVYADEIDVFGDSGKMEILLFEKHAHRLLMAGTALTVGMLCLISF